MLCLFLPTFAVKNRKAGFWTGLSRLAEAFSLNWSPSSPRQPHSPLRSILVKTGLRSIAEAVIIYIVKVVCTKKYRQEEDFSRKDAKAQSAAAFLRVFFAP